MADEISINYSYQPPASTAATGAAPDTGPGSQLYAAADCERVDLRNGGILLLHRHSGRQLMVASEVSVALGYCGVFRSLPEHVAHLTRTIPELDGQETDVAAVLGMLRDEGMLIAADSVLARLMPETLTPEPDPAATRVFIITCDRPAAVRRLLDSMLKNADLLRHEQLILVDDSRSGTHTMANREAVRDFNKRSAMAMQYLGIAQQQALLDALLKALPQHSDGIRFLLDRQRWAGHKSYGLARTLCLLGSVGRRAIVMDDDVVCRAVPSPHREEGLAFAGSARQVDFYRSQADVQARTEVEGFDPLAGHALCLGLGLGRAARALGVRQPDAKILYQSNAAFLQQWTADSPVLITQSGSLGDPGTRNTQWIYTLDPASAKRLLATSGGLSAAATQRAYWMGMPRPTFSKMAVISQVTGLDNTRLLPPYFPVFRGEDYLFGAMVEYLYPEAATLEYDWSVPHLPLEDRQGRPTDARSFGKFAVNPAKYVTDRTSYQTGIPAQTRLAGLVQLARELSEMSDRALVNLYRVEIAEAQVSRLAQLKSVLQDGVQRPPEWRAVLDEAVAVVNRSMQELAQPTDDARTAAERSVPELLVEFRHYARQFALGLESWPEVRVAASAIVDAMITAGDMRP